MKIRATPDLCAIGDAVLASNAPAFNSRYLAVKFRPETQVAQSSSKDQAWLFIRSDQQGASAEELLWIRGE